MGAMNYPDNPYEHQDVPEEALDNPVYNQTRQDMPLWCCGRNCGRNARIVILILGSIGFVSALYNLFTVHFFKFTSIRNDTFYDADKQQPDPFQFADEANFGLFYYEILSVHEYPYPPENEEQANVIAQINSKLGLDGTPEGRRQLSMERMLRLAEEQKQRIMQGGGFVFTPSDPAANDTDDTSGGGAGIVFGDSNATLDDPDADDNAGGGILFPDQTGNNDTDTNSTDSDDGNSTDSTLPPFFQIIPPENSTDSDDDVNATLPPQLDDGNSTDGNLTDGNVTDSDDSPNATDPFIPPPGPGSGIGSLSPTMAPTLAPTHVNPNEFLIDQVNLVQKYENGMDQFEEQVIKNAQFGALMGAIMGGLGVFFCVMELCFCIYRCSWLPTAIFFYLAFTFQTLTVFLFLSEDFCKYAQDCSLGFGGFLSVLAIICFMICQSLVCCTPRPHPCFNICKKKKPPTRKPKKKKRRSNDDDLDDSDNGEEYDDSRFRDEPEGYVDPYGNNNNDDDGFSYQQPKSTRSLDSHTVGTKEVYNDDETKEKKRNDANENRTYDSDESDDESDDGSRSRNYDSDEGSGRSSQDDYSRGSRSYDDESRSRSNSNSYDDDIDDDETFEDNPNGKRWHNGREYSRP